MANFDELTIFGIQIHGPQKALHGFQHGKVHRGFWLTWYLAWFFSWCFRGAYFLRLAWDWPPKWSPSWSSFAPTLARCAMAIGKRYMNIRPLPWLEEDVPFRLRRWGFTAYGFQVLQRRYQTSALGDTASLDRVDCCAQRWRSSVYVLFAIDYAGWV